MPNYAIIIIVILSAVLAVVSAIASGGNKSKIIAKPILTENETEFFYRLQRALPDYHIFPQVALGAILDASGNGNARMATRGYFSQKIADYVVCEKNTMKILAIVELDDKTHNHKKDARRDKMLDSAGYRTIRYYSKRKPSEAEITKSIAEKVASLHQG